MNPWISKAVIVVLGIYLIANSAKAQVSQISSPVEIIGGTTINFDQRPHNSVLNTFYQNQGITFSRDDGQPVFAYDYPSIGRTTPSPPNVLSTSIVPGINTSVSTHLNVFSVSPLYAVGAYWGNDRGDPDFTSISLSAFGASGNLLGSVTVLGNGVRSTDQFIGLRSDMPFTRIRFQNLNSSGAPSSIFAVAIDDLKFSAVRNGAPEIVAIPPQIVDEGGELTLTILATDADSPDSPLTFSLSSDAPTNAIIDSTSGVFTWTPSEEQGPSTNALKIIVTDGGSPSLSATQTMTVVVNEVNLAPQLVSLPSQSAYALTHLRVTNIVIDTDIPTNRMTFRLAPGAPPGSRINTNNGVFSWTPPRSYAPSSNHVTVVVTDHGIPPLSATNNFSVLVGDFAELSLGSTVVRAGQSGDIIVTMNSSAGVTNMSFLIEAPEDRLTNLVLRLFPPDVAGSLQPTSPSRSFVSLGAAGGGSLIGSRELGTLTFNATTNEESAFVQLTIANLIATQGNGAPVPRPIANNGRVVIVGSAPLLEVIIQTNGSRTLHLYGIPQIAYRLESTTNFTSSVMWNQAWQGTLTNLFQPFEVSTTDHTIFYRAVQQ